MEVRLWFRFELSWRDWMVSCWAKCGQSPSSCGWKEVSSLQNLCKVVNVVGFVFVHLPYRVYLPYRYDIISQALFLFILLRVLFCLKCALVVTVHPNLKKSLNLISPPGKRWLEGIGENKYKSWYECQRYRKGWNWTLFIQTGHSNVQLREHMDREAILWHENDQL